MLDWDARYNIVLGAAQGLAYLHHDCAPPILHRDVKPNNILLGACLEPYLADFGLAKFNRTIVDVGRSRGSSLYHSSSIVAGSYGYIAPGKHYLPFHLSLFFFPLPQPYQKIQNSLLFVGFVLVQLSLMRSLIDLGHICSYAKHQFIRIFLSHLHIHRYIYSEKVWTLDNLNLMNDSATNDGQTKSIRH